MGKGLIAVLATFGLALCLAVAGQELSVSEPGLSSGLFQVAVVTCLAVSGLLVLVWKRDTTVIASITAAPVENPEPLLPFEDREATPARSPIPWIDEARDTFGHEIVMRAPSPGGTAVAELVAEVEERQAEPVLMLEEAAAPAAAPRARLIDRLRRRGAAGPERNAREVVVQTHDIDSMRLEPAPERDMEPPLPGFEGLIEGWTPVYPADKD